MATFEAMALIELMCVQCHMALQQHPATEIFMQP